MNGGRDAGFLGSTAEHSRIDPQTALWTGVATRPYVWTVRAGGHITVENSSPRVQNVRVGSSAAGQPETEPYKGVFLMGDKGGKKDKKKAKDQKKEKQKIKDKKKQGKEPKRLT